MSCASSSTPGDTGVAAKDWTACSTPPSSTMGNAGGRETNVAEAGVLGRGFERRAAWPAKGGDDQFCERGGRAVAQRRVETSKDLVALELRPHRDGGSPAGLQYAAHFTQGGGAVGKELQPLLT